MKTLLIICGGTEAVPAILRAKEMGYRVVVSDGNEDAPGFEHADERLIANPYNPEQTASMAQLFNDQVCKIDGVICVAADAPWTVHEVTQKLGLPGISGTTAFFASDKFLMKVNFEGCKIPVPIFHKVHYPEELRAIIDALGPDLVIKPVDSRGSRGVQKLAQVDDYERAYWRAHQYSKSGQVMVEEYLSGPQLNTESIVIDGKAHTPCITYRNYEELEADRPYFVENGGDYPSGISEDLEDEVRALVERAAKAMGVVNGTVKGDLVIHERKPYIIEMAAGRLSGGYFATHEIPLSTGVDFVGCAIRLAMGDTVTPYELAPRFHRPLVKRYAMPPSGTVASITEKKFHGDPGKILYRDITARIGDVIPPRGDRRPSAAIVIATGDDLPEARKNAEDAIACLDIQTMKAC